jgi:hypothetical protein
MLQGRVHREQQQERLRLPLYQLFHQQVRLFLVHPAEQNLLLKLRLSYLQP